MRVLTNHETTTEVSLDLGLSSTGMLSNWIRDYQKNGYNVINRPIGRRGKRPSQNITKRRLSQKKRNLRNLKKNYYI